MKDNIFKEEDYQTILRRIDQLTPEHKKHWGKMNVTQMLCHTTDQIRLALGFMEAKDQSSFWSRNVVKHIALRAKMPKGIPIAIGIETVPELNQVEGGGTPSVTFLDDRVNLVKLLTMFKEQEPNYIWAPHPYFGELSRKQWGRLAYMHLDHHLEQFGV